MIETAFSFEPGCALPDLERGPITRADLALYAGASNDHVPLHIDSDFAKAAGLDDVIAHGMLSMAYLAQALKSWGPQGRLRRWNVRFTAMTPLHAVVVCKGISVEILEEGGERLARLHISAWNGTTQTLDGEAFIALA